MSAPIRDTVPPRAFWWMTFWGWAALGNFELLLPLLALALGAQPGQVGLIFSVFSLSSLSLRIVLGPVLDRWPRRPLLLGGLAIYVLALLLFATATSINTLVVARLLQGIGSTAVWLTASVLLAEWSGDQQATSFGRYQQISVWGGVLSAGWSGAVTLAFDQTTRTTLGRLLPLPHWLPPVWPQLDLLHLMFAGNALCALLALGAALQLRVPAPNRPAHERANRWLLFADWWQLRDRSLGMLIAVGVLTGVATGLLAPVQIVLLETRFGQGLVGIALAYGLPGVVYALVPAAAGRWADRHGQTRAILLGLSLPVLGYLGLPWASSVWLFTFWLCLEALGWSIASPALNGLLATEGRIGRGKAYAAWTFASGLGSALAQGAGGWLYERVAPALPFILAAGCMTIAALVIARRAR